MITWMERGKSYRFPEHVLRKGNEINYGKMIVLEEFYGSFLSDNELWKK